MRDLLCCVTPNWSIHAQDDPTDTTRPPRNFPPEWGYIAANSATPISVVDAYTRQLSQPATVAEVAAQNPKWIVLASTPSYLFWRCPPLSLKPVARLAASLRLACPGAFVVLVGPHGTVSPNESLDACPAVDLVFLGEPDRLLVPSLLQPQGKARPWLVSRNSAHRAVAAPQLPLGRSVPGADWIVGEPHCWLPAALKALAGRRGALLETTRGCRYDCGYCLRAGFRRDLRTKPLHDVAAEVAELVRRDVEYVFLIDETFGTPRSHARAIAKMLGDAGILWGMQTRPDLWTAQTLEYVRDRGCVYAEVGVETLDENQQRLLGKFRHPDRLSAQMDLFREHIPYVGFNTFDVSNPDVWGLPEGATVARDTDSRIVGSFIPYPGTPWGERALEHLGFREPSWEAARTAYALFKEYESGSGRGTHLRADLEARLASIAGPQAPGSRLRTRFEAVVSQDD